MMIELSLFTGAGGGLLGTKLLGWRCVGAVEWEEYPCKVLEARQKDGYLDEFPIWQMDIREFNRQIAPSYTGMVDVITAGFPCQPFSTAGKRRGADDGRNMWPATIAAINIIRPAFCFLENVPGLLSARDTICNECGYIESHWDDEREAVICSACGAEVVETAENTFWYFASILRDLAESGYDVRWRVLSAAEVGAPHKRDRLWILCTDVAYSSGTGAGNIGGAAEADRGGRTRRDESAFRQGNWENGANRTDTTGSVAEQNVADAQPGRRDRRAGSQRQARRVKLANVSWWQSEPDVGRVAHGVASRVDRIKALGNGQVPLVAAVAWLLLTKDI